MTVARPAATPAPAPSPDNRRWRGFATSFVAAAALLALAAFAFVVLIDPFGGNALRLRFERPLMDVNQRYLYPQIVRRRSFNSAVIGTSTVRLLDPAQLDAGLGGRFANLAMNAATPWEQARLAELFLRETPAPRAILWGVDATWCEEDADAPEKRITFRSFPRWAYDDDPWNDIPRLFNFRTVEIATRVIANRLGLMPERLRADGYEVFTPPEASYDLERARGHLWAGNPARRVVPVEPPVTLTVDALLAMRFPALAWLDATLEKSRGARIGLVMPPVHVAWQPPPGSAAEAREALCKARIADIARRHGAVFLDFRIASAITTVDQNYWDPLHYRTPIAARLVDEIAIGLTGATGPEGAAFVVR